MTKYSSGYLGYGDEVQEPNITDGLQPDYEPSNSKSGYTSLDDYLIDLVDEHFPKGKSKERGQANVMLAYFVMWHKAEVAKLLQVIEDEVIGEDVKYKNSSRDSDQLANSKKRSRNALKAEQRQALKQIKERL